MAIFSNPFGKKKKEEAPPVEGPMGPPLPPEQAGPALPARKIVPTDEVRALSSRGVPEPDIIRTLRREGYSTGEIDNAMKEALRSRVSGEAGPLGPPGQYGEGSLGGPPETMPAREEIPKGLAYPSSDNMNESEIRPSPFEASAQGPKMPEIPEAPTGGDFLRTPPPPMPEARAPSARSPKGAIDKREIEELAEVIVDEKLRELVGRFKTIDAQMQQLNKRIDIFSGEINAIKTEKSGEVKGIEEKIDNYGQNMDEFNGRIESLEKALKDSLTPMLESMRSLSELVKNMKEKKEK